MPGKHSDCCCCPNCTYRVKLCCPCVCPAICVTFTPDDYADCDPTSTELDWDDAINGYSGTLAGHDLYYYIERDPPAEGQERGPCKFKLRSNSLGYPEGYEYEWEIPCDPYEEIPCTTCLALETELSVPAEEYDECSGGTLTTYCVRWVTPTNCDNCHCLCECLCAFVTKDGIDYSGKLCWDDYEQNRWIGSLTGMDSYGAEVSLDMRVEVDRWGDVCDHETDYDCDPYDDSCAINAYIESEAGDIAANWQKMSEPCELRAVNYSWHIEGDPYTPDDDIAVSISCAECGDCAPSFLSCCEDVSWPGTLQFTLESVDGELNPDACIIWGEETATLTYDNGNWEGGFTHDLFWTEQYEMVFDISITGAIAVGACAVSISWYMRDVNTGEVVGDQEGFTLHEGGDLVVHASCDNLVDVIAEARALFESTGAPSAVMCCDPPFIFGKWSFGGETEFCKYEFTVTA